MPTFCAYKQYKMKHKCIHIFTTVWYSLTQNNYLVDFTDLVNSTFSKYSYNYIKIYQNSKHYLHFHTSSLNSHCHYFHYQEGVYTAVPEEYYISVPALAIFLRIVTMYQGFFANDNV